MDANRSTPLTRAAKRMAPLLSRCLMRPPFANILRTLDLYLQIIQGKGSGGGWDLVSEALAASRFLSSGDAVLFDVGANRGVWSREIRAIRSGQKLRIFQIEPSAFCQKILREEATADTHIIESAVGDRVGEVSFFMPEPGSGIASVHRQRDSYFQNCKFTEEKVPMTTLDEIVREHGIEKIDFMKMDVEGNELAVLRGAEQTLAAKKIEALSFEFGSPQINGRSYFHDFWDLLHPAGFKLLRICPGGTIHPVGEYYEDLEYFRGVTNYIAARENAMGNLKISGS